MKKILALLLILSTPAFATYSPWSVLSNSAGTYQAGVTSSNALQVDASLSPSLPLPTGAATSAGITSIVTALGTPFQTGGSIGNSSFGISGTLPSFTSTPTFNLGTLNGAATSALQSSTITALGTPFQAGGSIGNTSFGRTWTLLNTTDSVNVGNFPSTYPVTGAFWQTTQPVSIATMPTTPVTGAFFQTTQPVSIASMPSTPVTGTFYQSTQPVSAASLPLPAGAATSALQSTANTSLATIATNTAVVYGQQTMAASEAVVIASDQSAIPITASTLPLPMGAALESGGNLATLVTNTTGLATAAAQTAGNGSLSTIATNSGIQATAALQTTGNTSLATIATNSGTQATASNQTNASQKTQIVDGSGNVIASTSNALNVSVASIALPTGASTSALQTTGNTSLSTIATNSANTPVQGLANVTASTPVALPKATALATGTFNSTTGVLNWDMLSNSASGWYDAAGYTSFFADIYTTTTVTGGVITFEQTNDISNDASGITMNIQDSTVITQTNVTSLTLAASTIKHYQAPINARYIRFRFSTAFAGTGTVGATVNFRQTPYTPMTAPVSQATAGSLNTTATIASGTVTTVTTLGTITNAVPTKSPVNANSALGARQSVTGTESYLVAPANTIGVIVECESGNSDNLRWGLSNATTSILSTTLGMLCEPGRDTGFLPAGTGNYVHMIAVTTASSDYVDIQWVLSQ